MSSYAAPLPAMIQRPSSNVTAARPAVPAQGQPSQPDQQQQMMMLLLALLAGQQGNAAPPSPLPGMLPPGVPGGQ